MVYWKTTRKYYECPHCGKPVLDRGLGLIDRIEKFEFWMFFGLVLLVILIGIGDLASLIFIFMFFSGFPLGALDIGYIIYEYRNRRKHESESIPVTATSEGRAVING